MHRDPASARDWQLMMSCPSIASWAAQESKQEGLSESVLADGAPALEGGVDLVDNLYGLGTCPALRNIVVCGLAVMSGLCKRKGNGLQVKHAIEVGTWGRCWLAANELVAFNALSVGSREHLSMFVEPGELGALVGDPPKAGGLRD